MRHKLLTTFVRLQDLKHRMTQDQGGQDLIEYALVASLIALAATAGMTTVATAIGAAFTGIGTRLSNALT